jgi:hypothetical protein
MVSNGARWNAREDPSPVCLTEFPLLHIDLKVLVQAMHISVHISVHVCDAILLENETRNCDHVY